MKPTNHHPAPANARTPASDAVGHTPGPWKYLPDDQMVETAGPTNFRGEYEHICDFRSPVNEADARLIVAAPALLAALRATLQHCVTVRGMPDKGKGRTDEQQEAYNAARAAIRAATGSEY